MSLFDIFKTKSSRNDVSTITVVFKNGVMCDLYPAETENWYDARFLVSDGIKYDLEDINDLRKIQIPDFPSIIDCMSGYGAKGCLDYFLRMKSGAFFNRKEKEKCSACLWKATELMVENKSMLWSNGDFDRLIIWHYELGMIKEAEKAERYLKKIERYEENIFDSCAKSIRDSVFSASKKFNLDLIAFHDYGSGCCSECSKFRGRVYSISGKNKKLPKLPEYAKIHGNFHPGCRCTMSAFSPNYESEIFYKGERINYIKSSNRPWIDDRDDREKQLYEDYIERAQKEKEEAVKKQQNKSEYARILNLCPDIAPKSFNGYVRMKNSKSKNFLFLVEKAKEKGIDIK